MTRTSCYSDNTRLIHKFCTWAIQLCNMQQVKLEHDEFSITMSYSCNYVAYYIKKEGTGSDLPSSVIESIMVMYRLIFAWLSFSRPFGINSALNPGSIEKTYIDQIIQLACRTYSNLYCLITNKVQLHTTLALQLLVKLYKDNNRDNLKFDYDLPYLYLPSHTSDIVD